MAQDLTIIGGGIFGLSIAFECARRGAKVTLIEALRIGAGASGGLVGALAPHTPENWNPKKAFQLDSLLRATDFWADVQAKSGLDPLFARSGRLMPLADSAAILQAKRRGQNAQTLWQGAALWTLTQSADPRWAGHSPTGQWVHDTLSARIAPRAALFALAAAVRSLGGTVHEGTTAGFTNGPTLWATGTQGLHDLSIDLGRQMGAGLKGQAALFGCDARDQPQLFPDGLHIVPHGDGTVAVGSTSERDWSNPTSTDAALDQLISRARAACPMLAKAPVIDRWAALRPRAGSRSPLLGAWPGRPGHFVANGGFKIGFGMAPKVAQVMADLMLEGRDQIPDGFRITDCP